MIQIMTTNRTDAVSEQIAVRRVAVDVDGVDVDRVLGEIAFGQQCDHPRVVVLAIRIAGQRTIAGNFVPGINRGGSQVEIAPSNQRVSRPRHRVEHVFVNQQTLLGEQRHPPDAETVIEGQKIVRVEPGKEFAQIALEEQRLNVEVSAGQRVAIARALVLAPALVVADEPTSMLDVSVRAGVMKLMNDLRRDLGIGYLYITHDLATARYMCDRIAVMYMGKIVEEAETEELLRDPKHPYTRALLNAVPVPDPSYNRPPVEIKGSATAPIDPLDRCRFYERCLMAVDFCKAAPHPKLESKGDGRVAACYRV